MMSTGNCVEPQGESSDCRCIRRGSKYSAEMTQTLRIACLLVATLSHASAFSGASFVHLARARSAHGSRVLGITMKDGDAQDGDAQPRIDWKQRREVLAAAMRFGACGCAACFSVASPRQAGALAQLVEPAAEAVKKFDVPRDAFLDARFACGMATGMGDYEEAASKCY